MKPLYSLIESLVIGTGALLFLILAILTVLNINENYWDDIDRWIIWSEQGWLLFLPLFAVTYILGVIMDRFAFVVFVFWENGLRRAIQSLVIPSPDQLPSKNYYYDLRTYLHANGNASDLVNQYQFIRSKIRISRAWAINGFLIMITLIIRETQTTEFEAFTVPVILLSGIIMVGSLFSWYISVNNELKWLEKYNETLLR